MSMQATAVTGLQKPTLNAARSDKQKIRSRLAFAELHAEHAARSAITVDAIIGELNEAREIAEPINNPSAMVSASMAKAKLLGFLKDKLDR